MIFFERPLLAIETSCDETAASVLFGNDIRSNIIASQIEMHRQWGGVVPEAAARAHLESVLPVIDEALDVAKIGRSDLGAVAVTNRPGLVGALSVGVTAAKAIAFRYQIPLIGVHHLEGHLSSAYGVTDDIAFPHIALVVSGGHTELVHVRRPGNYEIIGESRDDAAGEAFDKGARLLGLGYPGGPAIQSAAVDGDPRRYLLPKGLKGETMDFSFSGLKTAMLRLVESEGVNLSLRDAAASLQETIVAVLTERAVYAVRELGVETLTLVGGVAANLALRDRLADTCAKRNIRFVCAPLSLCTDNAAMIGLAGSLALARGERHQLDLEPTSTAALS